MNRQMLYAGALLAFGLVACSDDRNSGPSAPDLQTTGTACKYSDVKQYARNLFGSNSPGYNLAQAMSTFSPNSAGATGKGFDIFAAIAAKRDGAGTFTSQNVSDAANLTVQVIACADVAVSSAFSVTTFSKALQPFGAYQVRGGEFDATTPVFTKNVLSGVKPAGSQTFKDWLGTLTPRTLFYAYPISTFSSEASGGRAYDWSVVRYALHPGGQTAPVLPPLTAPGLVSLCVDDPTFDGTASDVTTYRIQHRNETLNTILPFDPADVFLSCPAVLPPLPPLTLTQQIYRLFSPQPLFAAAALKTGSPTGSAGSFSPFEVVTPGSINSSFSKPPADGFVGLPIPSTTPPDPVTVLVTGNNGTPWQGTTVTVFGVNNNGAKEVFGGSTAVTDEFGLAKFPSLTAPKTGGYTVFAVTSPTANISSFDADTTQAPNRINIRPAP